jgi:hypothetical protein
MNYLKFEPALYFVCEDIPFRKVGGDSPEAGPAALKPDEEDPRFQPFSESALLLFFGDRILYL